MDAKGTVVAEGELTLEEDALREGKIEAMVGGGL